MKNDRDFDSDRTCYRCNEKFEATDLYQFREHLYCDQCHEIVIERAEVSAYTEVAE